MCVRPSVWETSPGRLCHSHDPARTSCTEEGGLRLGDLSRHDPRLEGQTRYRGENRRKTRHAPQRGEVTGDETRFHHRSFKKGDSHRPKLQPPQRRRLRSRPLLRILPHIPLPETSGENPLLRRRGTSPLEIHHHPFSRDPKSPQTISTPTTKRGYLRVGNQRSLFGSCARELEIIGSKGGKGEFTWRGGRVGPSVGV